MIMFYDFFHPITNTCQNLAKLTINQLLFATTLYHNLQEIN